MKLRNKKTGRVVEWFNNTDGIFPNTLAELNEEWEDMPEEPKGIKSVGTIGSSVHIEFETEEEAEKAVERLKAWKRLKDKGFRFECYTRRSDVAMLPEVRALKNLIDITAYLPSNKIEEMEADLDLLFGGEE